MQLKDSHVNRDIKFDVLLLHIKRFSTIRKFKRNERIIY